MTETVSTLNEAAMEAAINQIQTASSPTPEKIEADVRAIVNYVPVGSLMGIADPGQVVATLVAVAKELSQAINDLALFTVFTTKNGPAKHIRVEGWQMLSTMLGCTLKEEFATRIYPGPDGKGINGWEAGVAIVRNRDGLVIGRGTGFCGRDESNWRGRDEYALRSMAITRACSKSVKNTWGWIVKVAGFEPTPADEMTQEIYDAQFRDVPAEAQAPAKPQVPTQPAAPAQPVAPAAPAAPAQAVQAPAPVPAPAPAVAQPPKVSDMVANYAEGHYQMLRAQAMNVIKCAGFAKPELASLEKYHLALDLYAQLNEGSDLNDQTVQKRYPTLAEVEETFARNNPANGVAIE